MKTIVTLSAITLLAALALAGCSQNSPGSSTGTSATNMNRAGGTSVETNMPATNSLPDMNTNLAASTTNN